MRAIGSCIRWSARILSLCAVGLVLVMVVRERLNPFIMAPGDGIMIALLPFGVAFGMIAAWRAELAGGIITLACLALFYAVHRISAGSFPEGPSFALLASPGALFVVASLLSPPNPPAPADEPA